METLLELFSLEEILFFITLASLAIKGCVTFIDWAWARIKTITDAEYQSKKEKQELKMCMFFYMLCLKVLFLIYSSPKTSIQIFVFSVSIIFLFPKIVNFILT